MTKSSKFDSSMIKKGIFALAVVGVAGATGVVFAAPDTSQNFGYGNQQEAIDAVNRLNTRFNAASTEFVNDVRGYVDTAEAGLGADEETSEFAAAFTASSNAYFERMAEARADFLAQVQQAANIAESKDQFIDRYNNLKAAYFNELDAAKNEFAASLSPMGHNANVVKDQFMNSFNSARDAYGNELEAIKNEFANTISNL
ncbi:hypothetical protein JNJ66_02810 [Candidatus Saccharibacteria bacterium]|nr:hypothetical protein [Candidatus Saccharibacteria bacterium]